MNLPTGKVNTIEFLRRELNNAQEIDPYPTYSREMSAKLGEVCKLILKGLSNKQIAEQVNITEKGVKYRITLLFKAEKVKTRSELMAKKLNQQR